MDYKNRIIEILKKRGIEGTGAVEEFLNPTLKGFYSPFLLSGMDKAVDRIKKALKNNEKIVIYGDYDADGICAVSILHMFFKKHGASVFGFIPSRHHDGYGLTKKTVSFITNQYKPNLVITVDTGISAYDEIEEFNSLGVDTIVTDHHEPPQRIPNGIVIDPKIKGQQYPFNGLSGAGVALKLVQGLSSVEESLEYVDIAAISTIGDIVPLVDENRLITKLGLQKINSKKARPSILYFKSKLNITNLTSTDVAFKIVPRLNACGRMTTAEKCFRFLTETRAPRLAEIYAEMEEDNNLRLDESSKIMERVYAHVSGVNLNNEPAIFIVDKEINLGLIGIIASKLCQELYRPVFIFTEDEEGRLKASIRSIPSINIFEIIDKYRDILVDVGGHSLAGGLTIEKSNFNKFKLAVLSELNKLQPEIFENKEEYFFDDEIIEEDINLEFATELEKLEPYGYGNPKPIFKLVPSKLNVNSLKSYKHHKIKLGSKEIISFFTGAYLRALAENKIKKDIFINLELDTYLSKPRAKAILKSVKAVNVDYLGEEELAFAKLMHEFYLKNVKKEHCETKVTKITSLGEIKHLLKNPSHTLVVVDNKKDADKISTEFNIKVDYKVSSAGQTMVLFNPIKSLTKEEIKLYKTIVFIASYKNHLPFVPELKKEVYIVNLFENTSKINLTKEDFTAIYKKLIMLLPQENYNIEELILTICGKTKESASCVALVLFTSLELGFIKEEESEGVKFIRVEKPIKRDLLESTIYKNFV